MTPRYITSEQLAAYLGFGEGKRGANAIRQLVHRREIPYHKIGTRLRFDLRAIEKWMATRYLPPRAE